MKRILAFAAAAAVIVGAASVYAGGACCAAGKAKAKDEAKSEACTDMMSKLNLTDDQKTKITALKEECKKATSTSECHAMMSTGLERILTTEQQAQWKAECSKAAKSCEMKADKKG